MKRIKELRRKHSQGVMPTLGIVIWEEEIGFLPAAGGVN